MTPDWSLGAQAVPYATLDDPQTLNLYAYVRSNPLALVDPDGHAESCKENPRLCAAIRDAVANGQSIEEGRAAYQQSQQQQSLGESVKAGANAALTAVGNGISKVSDLLNTAPGIGLVMGLAAFAETGGSEETPAVAEAVEEGSNFVYAIQAEGETVYVGITNDLQRRAAEHGKDL